MIYIQYNPNTGEIGATVQTDGPPPVPPLQIAVPDDTELRGMVVDLNTLTLIPMV